MALSDPGELTYARVDRRDPDGRVRAHVPMVRRIAWHVHGRVSSAIEVEDLIQTGMVALIEAAQVFEERGAAFATYASVRVRGAMIDSLRRQAAQSRTAMAKRRTIDAARKRFEAEAGHAPGPAELAEAMGLDAATLREMTDAAQSIRHESIDELYSDHSMWFAGHEERADDAIERVQLQAALGDAIRTLPEREAVVLQLYFVEELNLDEIGETLGVGAARVCQIKKAALDKVRGMLGEVA